MKEVQSLIDRKVQDTLVPVQLKLKTDHQPHELQRTPTQPVNFQQKRRNLKRKNSSVNELQKTLRVKPMLSFTAKLNIDVAMVIVKIRAI